MSKEGAQHGHSPDSSLNRGSVVASNVTITDTLPSGFYYYGMISGPAPTIAAGPLLVWRGLSVGAGGRVDMVFRVRAFPSAMQTYWNNVMGSSPVVEIPDPGDTAPVRVVPSFTSFLPNIARNWGP